MLAHYRNADGLNQTPVSAATPLPVTNAGPGSTALTPDYTATAALTTGTDRSGTATTSSTTPIAANANRRGLYIQNIGANNIGYTEFGGTAAIGTAGTYTLTPGSSVNIRTAGAISMIAATGSTAFTATEF